MVFLLKEVNSFILISGYKTYIISCFAWAINLSKDFKLIILYYNYRYIPNQDNYQHKMKPFSRTHLWIRSGTARLATSALILNKIITGELSNY